MDNDEGHTKYSGWHIANFIIILIVIIVITLIFIEIYNHRALSRGLLLGWNVVEGVTNQSSDIFVVNVGNLYIGQSDQDLNLNLTEGLSWIGGQFGIKNDTVDKTIKLLPGAGVKIRPEQNLTVLPGVFSTWVYTNEGILRLDKTGPSLSNISDNFSPIQNSLQDPTQNIIMSP